MVQFIRSDLEFILEQIRIAERNAQGENLTNILPSVQVPFGLRTVDGSFNNLAHPEFGTADLPFPRLTTPELLAPYAAPGTVTDAQPRTISNLIVDQTANNPAAVAAASQNPGSSIVTSPGLDGIFGTADDVPVNFIPNITPDVGLSAPFNAWMTFFGQFFDHGLDLVTKSSTQFVFIPLQPDDPLFVAGSPTNFMVLQRAQNGQDATNTTSPFVDQSQTYASQASHQVFLRGYELRDPDGAGAGQPRPFATGALITNRNLVDGTFGNADDVEIGGMATWAVVKAQARDMLGINLTDADFDSVPLLATDAYGNFIKGPNGFPQVVMKGLDGIGGTADDVLVEGNPAAPVDLANAVRTGHAFLNDIAHAATPVFFAGGGADGILHTADDLNTAAYDTALLDAHYIAGDGRVNENIGLTAVHAVFHSEHNRLVEQTKEVALATGDLAFLREWLIPGTAPAAFPVTQAAIDALQWNGERLFQSAKFGTEMQYQHLVFEEFARTVQPQVDGFLAPNGYDTTINPAILAEFAHTVYRFGHSMLTETVDRFDPNFDTVGGDPQLGLIAAFLNPLAYAGSGVTPEQATGAIVRGVTRQVGNEIDEFVTEALRNNLLGLPLDLPALNIARGRDTGIPSLNQARVEFYAMTGDSQLKPYTSWSDFAGHLKHAESLINFIAAYGTHGSITGVATLAEKRAAATLIVLGGVGEPTDRLDFLNATGSYAGGALGGLNDIDFWIGGLAEEKMPFGGMLGSTFNFVFETQLESLQNGDRFYYLSRTAGMNFATELENNSFAKLVMLNSDATHLPNAIFTTPTFTLEVNQAAQHTGLGPDGRADPTGGIMINGVEIVPLVIRDNPATAGADTNYLRYTGEDHVVLGGTAGNDVIIAGDGDDTLYGDGGNDRLEGGYGNDTLLGGNGDDIIQDLGGDDRIEGGDGNDVIQAGNMMVGGVGNLILGGAGKDYIVTMEDISTTFGGRGDDFIYSSKTSLPPTGNEGDDWIELGTQDGAPGDNFAPLLADNVIGNDIFVGGGGFDEMIGEGGDDIFVGSDAQDKMDGMSGFDWVTYKNDGQGVTVDLTLAALAQPHGETPASNAGVVQPVAASPASILDRFAEVEGLSGSRFADILRGDDVDAVTILNHGGATGGALTNVALIDGLGALLSQAGLSTAGFATGNIMLGGAGSDLLEGRGGDDLIDGDRWLNVRISVRANADGTGGEIASFDSMVAPTLLQNMLNGVWNPGQLVAVREIIDDNNGFDTAIFTGNRADYTVTTVAGTTTVTDNVGTDGTDTLVNVERLQFADQSLTLPNGVGLNADPTGQLVILDANSAPPVPDGTPTSGQLLRVSIAGVADADGGPVAGSISYHWQFEATPGSGIFEDIILLPLGDLAFQSADGTTFRVTPDLAGSALRVKAIFTDGHGVTETVFSAPTDPVVAGPATPPVAPTPVVDATAGGEGIMLVRSDLNFILDQIKIAEANAAGTPLTSLLPNVRVPLGLRTVDGSGNNLLNLQQSETFGAADNVFPRVTTPVFKPAQFGTSYQSTTNTFVIDSQPRTISNLVVDQTMNNPAAIAAALKNAGSQNIATDSLAVTAAFQALNAAKAGGDPAAIGVTQANFDAVAEGLGLTVVTSPGLDGAFGTPDDKQVFEIQNIAPDAGLSAPFNAWMTFFGQFFDHGLDLVTKGGSGTVFIPLQPDDPLYVQGSPTNFMVLTRATNQPGPDGILGNADDIHEHTNTTSPFVDQNQTYSSHPSHQVFLRGYQLDGAGEPVATGRLITNRDLGVDGKYGTADDIETGGMATWKVVKAQARDMLGINLTDADLDSVPLLATDAYGNFIKGPNGFPQVVMKGLDGIGGTADDVLVEGNPLAPVNLANAVRTGHAFLNDIAHNAVPVFNAGVLAPDADTLTGNAVPVGPQGNNLEYDNELLDAHYIAGDGRVNENIGLTAVHSIFHAEHNRLVEQTKNTVLNAGDLAFLNEWLMPGTEQTALPVGQAAIDSLQWNGERLFQAAKFGTEMQYQHLVFEEFARTIQPNVDLFFAPTQVYDVNLDPSIVAEFAHTVYRFGHSMLTETVDRFDGDFNVIGDGSANPDQQMGLIAAFLNPLAFAASGGVGGTPDDAVSAIVRGVTRQVGNEIDEFVTEALRNNLLGLPLDLPAINIARSRDTGIPSLNEVRRQIYEQTGEVQLKPYASWADLVQYLKHPESVINFIAAYGTHAGLQAADVNTMAEKRAMATALVLGGSATINAGAADERIFTAVEADRLDFLNATGIYAGGSLGGLNDIDLWIGGLAEEKMPFGGMLGSTFNFIFENQLEKLQDGDRFYYLERTAGLSFNAELESNSFAKLIMANTNAVHLPGVVFTTPGFTLEVNQAAQHTGLGVTGRDDPTNGDPLLPLVVRDNPDTLGPDANYLRYTGDQHVVLGGTAGNDIIISSEGDDTLWGDAGNDRLEGGFGNDQLRGGAGDDIITDEGGDDNIQGGDGNDVLHGGNGINLIIGGFGNDFIITGEDASEAIGGQGNDFILGSKANEQDMGNEGDDWIEKGTSDGAPGDNFDPLGNDPVIGNDVFIGDGENDKFNGEGGDDIMAGKTGFGDRYIGGSGYDWASYKYNPAGVYIDISDRFFDQPPVPGGSTSLSRFDFVEGISGSRFGDVLNGDDSDAATLRTAGATGSVLTNIDLIDGLRPLLPAGATFFDGGNIILGGAGSDILQGRGGDDIIDGDRYLNVRISVRANLDGTGAEIASFDSMEPMVPLMLNGTYNPGQLVIVREILTSATADFDTAKFSGLRASYTVTANVDGSVTVTDNVGTDGTDTLRNIERLEFADGVQVLGGTNALPQGRPVVVDPTPLDGIQVGDVLTVSLAGLTDADNPGGIVPAFPVSYFWQVDDGTGFADIETFGAGEVERVHGPRFTVTDGENGLPIRLRMIYQDANGVLEEVFSLPTATVGANVPPPPPTTIVGTRANDVLVGTAGADTITGDRGDDIITGLGGADTIDGGRGADTINGGDGADTIDGGRGDDIINGGLGNDTILGDRGNDLIIVGSTEGRDIIDGGRDTDTVRIVGDASAEAFQIYAAANAPAAFNLAPATQIAIVRNGLVIAELANIEEIQITGGGGGDTFQVIGNFAATTLFTNTITIDGSTGDDTVDISTLASAHRIVFRSMGGHDTILGVLRPQDVIELAPGATLANYTSTSNGNGTTTLANGGHTITFATLPGGAAPNFTNSGGGGSNGGGGNGGGGNGGGDGGGGVTGAFELTARDVAGLKLLVNGQEVPGDDDAMPGIRDLSGHGNNVAHPDYGAADEPFIRLTEAHFGAYDPAIDNNKINPIFEGLDPRNISNILGVQEADLPKNANDANIFFMAFGQYFDHGLDFLPKGGHGTIQIGAPGNGAPGSGNPADLTRGTVDSIVDGVPQHINRTSPFADQNQAYGSNGLVGQFLRESDGHGGLGSRLLAGAPDPSDQDFRLLPTLRELILEHWQNDTVFTGMPGGPVHFRTYFAGLVDGNNVINTGMAAGMASNFMGSGHALLLDANPFVSVLDHYIAGDGRANENFALTAMHTIWARNHNFHVENLIETGFQGTAEELFQAAKIINEAEYQRVVFNEFADHLIGGIKGDGDHGHGGYNPDATAGISHEFAAAVYRVGHSLIGQTMTVLDENGQPRQVALFDAFLNPTNDAGAFTAPLPPGYVPQPGYEQLGVASILGGIITQPAEEVDFNIVDAVRNDLVRINADLFAFNVARGWDIGLGTLNQVRADLAASQDRYVAEAIGFAGDVSAYASWEDFQQRNDLSDAVIAQFRQAYPDLVLDADDIAAFRAINSNIDVAIRPDGTGLVKGIDRVDLWVGGLAESHINGGMVGQTFWVVLHEQFDRLQEADRFYYKDRVDNFDFYENFIDGQEFANIIARNTSVSNLPEHIFETAVAGDGDNGTGNGDDGDDDDGDDDDDDGTVGSGDDDDGTVGSGGDDDDDCGCDDDVVVPPPGSPSGGALRVGTAQADVLLGTAGADNIIGLAGDDVLIGEAGDDTVVAGEGSDFVDAGEGTDIVFLGGGDDHGFGGAGDDALYGEAGDDRVFGGAGNDRLEGGAGSDTVVGGAGNDLIVAAMGDGNDTYHGDDLAGGTGIDTLDMSAITASITVDLGSGLLGRGGAVSIQSGQDTLWGIENVATGSGNDTITASSAVNVMEGGAGNDVFRFTSTQAANGDTILDFEPGDRLDLSGIDANAGLDGNQGFTIASGASFTASAQLLVTYETRADGAYTVIAGNVNGDQEADFQLSLKGSHTLSPGSNIAL